MKQNFYKALGTLAILAAFTLISCSQTVTTTEKSTVTATTTVNNVITGRLVDSDGTPISKVLISYVVNGVNTTTTTTTETTTEAKTKSARTVVNAPAGTDGTFTLNIPNGTYAFWFEAPAVSNAIGYLAYKVTYSFTSTNAVSINLGDIVLPTLAGTIKGTVLQNSVAGTTPLANTKLILSSQAPSGSGYSYWVPTYSAGTTDNVGQNFTFSQWYTATTDATGAYTFTVPLSGIAYSISGNSSCYYSTDVIVNGITSSVRTQVSFDSSNSNGYYSGIILGVYNNINFGTAYTNAVPQYTTIPTTSAGTLSFVTPTITTNIPVSSPVVLSFLFSKGTLSSGAITLYSYGTGANVAIGTPTYTNSTITITPTAALTANTSYRLTYANVTDGTNTIAGTSYLYFTTK